MALPRRILRQLREGTYQKSAVGKKAREAAARLREPTPQPPERPTFRSVKQRMRTKKHLVYREVLGYSARNSNQAVEDSEAYDKMVEALEFTNDQMDEFAARASLAWKRFNTTGNAGELTVYLDYDFLWYH